MAQEFEGRLAEIPNIKVDYFIPKEGEDEVKYYFLSNIHNDYRTGLYWYWDMEDFFNQILIAKNRFLYATEQTVGMLIQCMTRASNIDESIAAEQLRILNYNEPKIVDANLTVTAIPSGSCLGSAMFHFKTTDQSVLYTGAYRMDFNDLHQMADDYNGIVDNPVGKIYLDTTFFLDNYPVFPTRELSSGRVVEILRRFLNEHPGKKVLLELSSRYGYETLFQTIRNELDMSVHVDDKWYYIYSQEPDLANTVTDNGEKTVIHARSAGEGPCQPINYYRASDLIPYCCEQVNNCWLTIKMSGAFDAQKLRNGISEPEFSATAPLHSFYRVCYAMHASLEECQSLLKFLGSRGIDHGVMITRRDPRENAEIYGRIRTYDGQVLKDLRNAHKIT